MPAKKIIRAPRVKKTHFIIANFHTGSIVIPQRKSRDSSIIIRTNPLIIPPGHCLPIDSETWNELRKNRGIQNYLDAKLLGEVEREGEVPVTSKSTTVLPIPEHLLREGETPHTSEKMGVSANLRRQTVSSIEV